MRAKGKSASCTWILHYLPFLLSLILPYFLCLKFQLLSCFKHLISVLLLCNQSKMRRDEPNQRCIKSTKDVRPFSVPLGKKIISHQQTVDCYILNNPREKWGTSSFLKTIWNKAFPHSAHVRGQSWVHCWLLLLSSSVTRPENDIHRQLIINFCSFIWTVTWCTVLSLLVVFGREV